MLVGWFLMRVFGMAICFGRVLQSLPGPLLSGLVILFARIFRGSPVCVGCQVVQLSRPLMILVMGSVVVARGHQNFERQSAAQSREPRCRPRKLAGYAAEPLTAPRHMTIGGQKRTALETDWLLLSGPV